MSDNVHPSIDLVTAMGRLLSDWGLREEYARSPESVAKILGVADSDRQAFLALDVNCLNRQAETLLNKRWHEVRRLIPHTTETLGDEAFELFRFFAIRHWPGGHRRHFVDALHFLEFLEGNGVQKSCRSELRRMRQLARR